MKSLGLFILLFSSVAFGQLDGIWHSSFHVAGQSFLMDVSIEGIGRDGTITVSVPDQPKLKPQVMTDYALFRDSVYFKWERIGLSFSGKLRNDSLAGTMKQSGLEWPVIFTKSVQEVLPSGRPQDPIGPFSYEEKQLIINNKKVQIAGTLTLPSEKDFPILILVSGSGPQNRNCEIMGHRPFWVFSDFLTKNGVAVFRYDDRGVGESTGDFETATETDFTSDLVHIFAYLKKKYPNHPIGIYGHSEGGMIGLRAASEEPGFRFLIESASVGTNGKDVLVHQQYDIPLAAGSPEEDAKWNARLFEKAAEIVLEGKSTSFLNDYKTWLSTTWEKLPPTLINGKSLDDVATEMSTFINSDWAQEFLTYQASTYLKNVEIPLLVINGQKDIQVRWEENQLGFKQNMSPKTSGASKFIAYEDLNHLLQPCIKCDVMEYAAIETSMSPVVMTDVLNWIKSLK